MKNINLFLDDIRTPDMAHKSGKGLGSAYSSEDKWVIARDYFEFIDIVNNHFDDIDLVSFDHDLACYKNGVEYTGKTAEKYKYPIFIKLRTVYNYHLIKKLISIDNESQK